MLRARDSHVPLYMMYLLAWDRRVATNELKAFVSALFAIAFMLHSAYWGKCHLATCRDYRCRMSYDASHNLMVGIPAEAEHKRVTDFWGLSNCAVLSESMTMPVRYLEQTTKDSSKELARFAKKERLCTSETYCHSKPPASVRQQISGSLARKSWWFLNEPTGG